MNRRASEVRNINMGIFDLLKKNVTKKKIDFSFFTTYIANNDNIIKEIIKENEEYKIQIELWNAEMVELETVNCDSLKLYDFDVKENVIGTIKVEEFKEKVIEIEIGDIKIEPYNKKIKYLFKDAWENEYTLLEIIADKLLINKSNSINGFDKNKK